MRLVLKAAVLLACLTFVAPETQAQPRPPRPPDNVLTPYGMGEIRIGMGAQDALRVLGRGWRLGDPLEEGDANGCRHIEQGTPESDFGPVGYLIEDMRVRRIEVSTPENGRRPTIASETGIRIGQTEAEVRRAHPQGLLSEPHAYDDRPAAYLTQWVRGAPSRAGGDPAPGALGIRYVTDNQRRVVAMYAGDPSIQYIEGCA